MNFCLTVRLTPTSSKSDETVSRLFTLARREWLLFELLSGVLSRRSLRKGWRGIHENVLLLERVLLLSLTILKNLLLLCHCQLFIVAGKSRRGSFPLL